MTKRMKKTLSACLAAGLRVESHEVWPLFVSIAQREVRR